MSGQGEIIPELVELLRDIADRIRKGTATARDAEKLDLLASQAGGEHRHFSLKVHRRRGGQSWGAKGVDRRLAMARAVQAYKDEHNCTNAEAYEALDGTLGVG